MIIQLCGMSGAGKSTLSETAKIILERKGIQTEVLDGDDYRKNVFKELGYTKEDRNDNIRRLAFIANKFSQYDIVSIICAINPYTSIRKELSLKYPNILTVYIDCSLTELVKRDTKGLYKKALLPEGHIDKIYNLTGVNDPFESPEDSDLIIHTDEETVQESALRLVELIESYRRNS